MRVNERSVCARGCQRVKDGVLRSVSQVLVRLAILIILVTVFRAVIILTTIDHPTLGTREHFHGLSMSFHGKLPRTINTPVARTPPGAFEGEATFLVNNRGES
eukprot:1195047-Prorocentrum_minimum.AAC.14